MSWSDLLVPCAVLFLLSGAAYFINKIIINMFIDVRA